MFSEKDLIAEVEAAVNSRQCAIETDWIANLVMSNHRNLSGDDSEFYLLCAWAHVKDAVRVVVRRFKPSPEEAPDSQIILPGFERLQTKYHMERGGKSWLVPIDELTDEEIDRKVSEYESIGRGVYLHAAELLRYKNQRGQAA